MPKRVDAKKRQEEILTAAVRVFSESGYHDTRLESIARAAGLSKGSIYHYFESKEDVFLKAFDHVVHRLEESLVERLETLASVQPAAPRTVLEQGVQAAYKLREVFFVFLIFKGEAALEKNAKSAAHVRNLYRRWRSLLAQFISEKQPNGFLEGMTPDEAAMVLLGLFEGLSFQWLFDPENFDWNMLRESLLKKLFPEAPAA